MFAFGATSFSGEIISEKSGEIQAALQCSDSSEIYTVKPGDKLYEIGNHFGSSLFWEAIYIANADLIDNPDLIYVGQKFKIPHHVASYQQSGKSLDWVLNNPFCSLSDKPLTSVKEDSIYLYDMNELDGRAETERDEWNAEAVKKNELEEEVGDNEDDRLAEFREAFEAVIVESESLETEFEEEQRKSERQLLIEIDGMIHDETRSKVGRDFYDVFYSNWQSPPDAYNFTINISEQPSPSLGTIIYVEVNDNETFRMRLQPRYDFIQQAGQYAVRQTYSYLQNNDHQLQIY